MVILGVGMAVVRKKRSAYVHAVRSLAALPIVHDHRETPSTII
jgi:hypothetical protein